jgi:perosamine synthetase
MYIPENLTLSPLLLLKSKVRDNLWNSDYGFSFENTIYFSYGRNAIWYAMVLLRLEPQNNILVPAYTCDAVIEPIIAFGLQIKFYQINRNLQWSIDGIESKIDRNTQAIYAIHFFGFPCEIQKLQELCQMRGIYLIEDCAHSPFSKIGSQRLGSYGHMSIFSLRKFFPIPNGGALRINERRLLNGKPAVRLRNSFFLKDIVTTYKLLQKHLNTRLGISLDMAKIRDFWSSAIVSRQGMSAEGNHKYDVKMSSLARFIINRTSIPDTIRKRQENYHLWHEVADSLPMLSPIYTYRPDGICAYSFPVLVENRDELLSKLRRRGIFLEATFRDAPFDGIPNLINREESFPDTEFIADRIISLPVHQNLAVSSLEKIADTFKRL